MFQKKWKKILHKINNTPISTQHFVKKYNISNRHKLFKNYPNRQKYINHINTLCNGTAIGIESFPQSRLKNCNPKFTVKEKIGIGTQLLKWRQRGTVLGPIPYETAKNNNIVINKIFGVPKPNGDTRPILNLKDNSVTGEYVNNHLYDAVCTTEYKIQRISC